MGRKHKLLSWQCSKSSNRRPYKIFVAKKESQIVASRASQLTGKSHGEKLEN